MQPGKRRYANVIRTGGAKLAAGMQEEVGLDLTVIANTGDDVEALGVHVSPDPDLVTYWLSGEIDAERGWGIKDDGFVAFERLKRLGAPDWFGVWMPRPASVRRTESVFSQTRLRILSPRLSFRSSPASTVASEAIGDGPE